MILPITAGLDNYADGRGDEQRSAISLRYGCLDGCCGGKLNQVCPDEWDQRGGYSIWPG
jgi:hypothetical protein